MALKQSAKEAEDKQMKEALDKSEADSKRRKEDDPPAQAAASSGSATVQPGDNFTEKDVQDLMKYKFSRESIIKELREHNGDVKTATAALFAKSLKF